MSANQLYDTWFRLIRELHPAERVTRIRNLAWLIVGMLLSRSVHLSTIAAQLPFRVALLTIVQRLSRFLSNQALNVRDWYCSTAKRLLTEAAQHGAVRLIIDGSKVSAQHQLLMVALAFRKRALPMAWTWVKGARGHSGALKQLALLSYVRTLLPEQATVELVGDCEFGSGDVLRQLEHWHWNYVLRQKGNETACVSAEAKFCQLASLVQGRDKLAWYPRALLTSQLFRTHVLTYWESGQADPWLLATNLPEAHTAWHAYRRRMWIEEMFGDWKGHGLDLETTRLPYFQRLSRLTLAVALWYLGLVTSGVRAIRDGRRAWVDRKNRRDLSVFRIGLYIVDRCCACGSRLLARLIPYF